MSLFANFLVSAFGGLFGLLATWFGKKVAVGTSLIAGMTALTLAFFAAIKLLTTSLASQISNEWVLMGFYMFWPSNAEACIGAVLAAEVLAFVYRLHMATIHAVAAAN